MTEKTPTRRQQKEVLFAQNPFCHWCKRLTVIYGDNLLYKPHPKDLATLDHLISRYHRKKGEKVGKVLACNECNNKRSAIR